MKGLFDFTVDELGPCKVKSPIQLSKSHGDMVANYVYDNEFVRYNVDVYGDVSKEDEDLFKKNLIEKAGPRELIYFNPKHVNAGICTCGGLCPGLNDVIRAVVRCLWNRYGVRRIRGIRFGFKGLLPEQGFDTIDLNPDLVDDIHKTGGSFLGTSRGGGDRVNEIVDAIEALNMKKTIDLDLYRIANEISPMIYIRSNTDWILSLDVTEFDDSIGNYYVRTTSASDKVTTRLTEKALIVPDREIILARGKAPAQNEFVAVEFSIENRDGKVIPAGNYMNTIKYILREGEAL